MHILGKKPIPAGKKNGPVTKKTPEPRQAPSTVDATEKGSASKGAEPMDTLDRFEWVCNEIDPMRALMLLFWKNRHQDQPFTVDIMPADLQGFEECIKYLDVTPQIKVFRPQGTPAHPGSPATESRSAVPPRPAGKPKGYVVVQMVDQEGNAFVPIENNEDDQAKGQEAKRLHRIRESAPQLAAQLMADLQSNTTSNATITEAAEALKLLARA